MEISKNPLGKRFRGYLPVIVDIETAGFNAKKNPLLEIAAVIVEPDQQGLLQTTETHACNIIPFRDSELDDAALKFTNIDPYHPFRMSIEEKEALSKIFKPIKNAVKRNDCSRAILVGHNPTFDMNFLNAAIARTKTKRSPFHPFSSFDTATLGGLVYGQTVLAKIAKAANLEWDSDRAHSALYDAEQTAKLFCMIVNRWKKLEELEQTKD
ncbi:MAG: ribonuclease T [Methylococcales symbiont of Hymedesmia sp. n. MRB-2018]|nr:MAG: ribonuclease T [Methylococcales symbiont of Hymedesmia sp. n. MRB-2018]KAF3984489.1 MAG: ribonuclease T [Methylococcales symbiont of Hymedesmia sp. n. MRB-2018]ORU94846.1 MAG: ribonuclease T [Cycloclasticus sp. symbiont of Poecilosclerida sp. N]